MVLISGDACYITVEFAMPASQQCCGSMMFILDPRSQIQICSIPDPGSIRFPDPGSASASNNLSFLT
jgi:hypothetical protein